MKKDARVQQTERMLREALFQCLKEKPIKYVTISEVCDRAEINRATFYKHYKDCYDIVSEIEQEQLEEFRNYLESKKNFGKELTIELLGMIQNRKEINEAARAGMLSDEFRRKMTDLILEYAFDDWKRIMPKASDQEVEFALTVMLSASLDAIVNYGDKYDSDMVVHFVTNMINSSIKMYS